jgi:hypothetical protein
MDTFCRSMGCLLVKEFRLLAARIDGGVRIHDCGFRLERVAGELDDLHGLGMMDRDEGFSACQRGWDKHGGSLKNG